MENKEFISKVFLWLFVGLLVSFGTAYYTYCHPNMLYNIFSTKLYLGLFILELVLVIFLSARIHKMSYQTAILTYGLYALVNGLTLSVIFLAYQMTSIVSIFGISALIFLIFGAIGYYTKKDLSKIGTYLLMILVGIVLATLVNMFLGNELVDIIISSIGVIVFVLFIAYDMNKLKQKIPMEKEGNYAIIFAFNLYLDFINLFVNLLRLFGNSKD